MAYRQRKGPLPDADAMLMHITRTTDAEWMQCKDEVLAFFERRNGLLYHGRIERDLLELLDKSNKNKAAAEARWNKNNANAMQTQCKRNAEHMPYHSSEFRVHSSEEEKSAVLGDWYKKHQAKTARLVAPSDPDRLAAKDLGNRYPPEELSAAVAEYWENWPDYWFAVKNGDMKKPREDRKPMYLFASFAKNIEELLQNKSPPFESRLAPQPVESIICPVCGTNETPDTRMRCRKCGFYLDPSWINDPELIAEYTASKQKEGEDA
jgi:uncharacterized protein YdaU (DUF1376 family)